MSRRFARRVHRPELTAQAAFAQSRDVGLAGYLAAQVVRFDAAGRFFVVADRPGKVVVTVDENDFLQQFPRMGECGIGLVGCMSRGADERCEQGSQQKTVILFHVDPGRFGMNGE